MRPLYEVHGIGFPNKGAELMLSYVTERMRAVLPDARFMCQPNGIDSVRTIVALGGRLKLLTDVKHMNIRWLSDRAPRRILDWYGVSAERDAVGVLDASGFAYGDFWGAQKVRRAAVKAETHKKRGGFYVLLPQACGPFTDPSVAYWARRLVRASDLTFARDDESKHHLERLRAGRPIHRCPDITIDRLWGDDWAPRNTRSGAGSQPRAIVIPNEKLLDPAGGGHRRDAYVQFLSSAVLGLQADGYAVALLNHEGDGDDALCSEVLKRLPQPIPYIRGLGAIDVKREIAQSALVLTSRFHGAVSSLSQGVPCAILGWSHKYVQLARDFDVEDWCLDARLDVAVQQLRTLTPRAASVARGLVDTVERLQDDVTGCWDRVADAVHRSKRVADDVHQRQGRQL